MLSPDDVRLLTLLHGGFPLTDRPFADVAATLGWGEDTVIERLRHLLATGVLSRFGPLFQIERAEPRFDAVAAQVNAWPEVAHNYRREHALNMWFVVAAESPAQAQAVLQRIEADVGLPVFAFPKEREFFVELKLPLDAASTALHRHAA